MGGTEGVDCITAIAISQKAHLLAVCEKGDSKATCSIYHLHSRKRQRVIPENEGEISCKAKEFLGAVFCPKLPERYLVTLSGDPDWSVHLWQHDVFKCLAKIELNIVTPPAGSYFKISECNVSTDLTVVVTGP